jgi:3-dehydroquinate synthase
MSGFETKVKFLERMTQSGAVFAGESLVIYDRVLLKLPEFKTWLKKFRNTYPVTAGENLKELKKFPQHFENIAKLLAGGSRDLRIIAVGGGSVTDFAGFFASTYKRGVKLVLVPSTWLCAIDSAHGGKNALNAGNHKNSLGTFYFPEKILIVKSLLMSQSQERLQEVYGELLKIALISGKNLAKGIFVGKKKSLSLWKLLPVAIEAKYEIVKQDPFEKKGVRQVLNLGHTLGHVIEKERKLAHGLAVGQGIIFASRWSEKKGLLKTSDRRKIESLIRAVQGTKKVKPLRRAALLKGLNGDKKMNSGKINFVFLRGPGKVFANLVSVNEVADEAIKQGWAK